jgi:hypothetical protein
MSFTNETVDDRVLSVAENATDSEYTNYLYISLIIFPIFMVIGNSLVIIAVLFDPKLRQTITNKFIASLAVSDLFMGLFVTPFAIYVKVFCTFE